MTNNNNWPDPARPGVPLNPEVDGPHMMQTTDDHGRVWLEVWAWRSSSRPQVWLRPTVNGPPYGYEPRHLTAPIYAGIRYLGPCLTPAEVAAQIAAAVAAEREACAAWHDEQAAHYLERSKQRFSEGWLSGGSILRTAAAAHKNSAAAMRAKMEEMGDA
jgi:hypothetical protein